MAICLKCGKENEKILCNKCKDGVNIVDFCNDIISYNFEETINPVFETVANEIGNLIEFKKLVFDLTEDVESPMKELLRLKALTNNGKYLSLKGNDKEYFYESAAICLQSSEISEAEKDFILSVEFYNYVNDYNYSAAEEIANLLKDKKQLNKRVYYSLADFYIKTRRYDLADFYLKMRISRFDESDNDETKEMINKKVIELEKRRNGEHKEYMPAAPENREKYAIFMNSIRIDISKSANNKPKKMTTKEIRENKIPDNEYPDLKENEISHNNFDTFVAFDFETTGLTNYDEITEIGAIRVINGKIVESAEFTFQELVHPDKRRVSSEVEEKTGITNDMLKGKEKIWDVFPRFMEFVGDDILVGFNCMNFDRRLLRKAGRYSRIIINNPIYDVMKHLKGFDSKEKSLEKACKKLHIENSHAHRALADAIATAKLFMEVKSLYAITPSEENKKIALSPIKITGGRHQQSDNIVEIWENLMDDCSDDEKMIIQLILDCKKENIEKPIYNANVEILNTKDRFIVNELWEKAKIMLFLEDNKNAYLKAQNTGYKCYMLSYKMNIKEFFQDIELEEVNI